MTWGWTWNTKQSSCEPKEVDSNLRKEGNHNLVTKAMKATSKAWSWLCIMEVIFAFTMEELYRQHREGLYSLGQAPRRFSAFSTNVAVGSVATVSCFKSFKKRVNGPLTNQIETHCHRIFLLRHQVLSTQPWVRSPCLIGWAAGTGRVLDTSSTWSDLVTETRFRPSTTMRSPSLQSWTGIE